MLPTDRVDGGGAQQPPLATPSSQLSTASNSVTSLCFPLWRRPASWIRRARLTRSAFFPSSADDDCLPGHFPT